MGISFVGFYCRENRCSLASFDRKEIAHLEAIEIARCCGGAVKIAAATAENRAILVHSSSLCLVYSLCGSHLEILKEDLCGLL